MNTTANQPTANRPTAEQPMWTPSDERVRTSQLWGFMDHLRARFDLDFKTYDELWRWSCRDLETFWLALWQYCGIVSDPFGERIIVDGDKMPGARFFPEANLNFAENLLKRRDEGPAIIFRNEAGLNRQMSWAELRTLVAKLAVAMIKSGIEPGDRVAVFMPSLPETVAIALAATAIGATFSSCAPDFGVRGVLDRLGQIEPKMLFAVDGHLYAGKRIGSLDRLPDIVKGLPTVERTVILPYLGEGDPVAAVPNAVMFDDFIADVEGLEVPFKRLPFDHPVYIMFSSGTTGVPKCIEHRAGGVLLQHYKELIICNDVKANDRVLFYTSTNWMVWNVHVSYLLANATMLIYDGSPFHPAHTALWDFAQDAKATLFGTSAKYIDAMRQEDMRPAETHDLSALRTIVTSGSTLVEESFDHVYEHVKKDVHLASVSGGTDLAAGFVGANPIGPVWRGEIQAPALAMAVEVFDDEGKPLGPGQPGELVCTKPFPSLPLRFLDDPGDRRYHESYFEMFPNVWRHGDLMAWTEHGGAFIYGRSDATLNPGGIRIGTAEIYRQAEIVPEVVECLAIGQDWPPDTRIVLFVTLREGVVLDDELRDRIRKQIRDNATPRHVPAKIIQVADIPRTKTGKIVELAVRDVVHGRPVKNKDALANPEALTLFEGLEELRT